MITGLSDPAPVQPTHLCRPYPVPRTETEKDLSGEISGVGAPRLSRPPTGVKRGVPLGSLSFSAHGTAHGIRRTGS